MNYIQNTVDELRKINGAQELEMQMMREKQKNLESQLAMMATVYEQRQRGIGRVQDDAVVHSDERKDYTSSNWWSQFDCHDQSGLRKQTELHQSEFTRWDSQSSVQWILSLERGRFRKYEDALRQNLKEENVRGIDLGAVTADDLKGWGVKGFGDRKALFDHIQSLIQRQTASEGTAVNVEDTAYF